MPGSVCKYLLIGYQAKEQKTCENQGAGKSKCKCLQKSNIQTAVANTKLGSNK